MLTPTQIQDDYSAHIKYGISRIGILQRRTAVYTRHYITCLLCKKNTAIIADYDYALYAYKQHITTDHKLDSERIEIIRFTSEDI